MYFRWIFYSFVLGYLSFLEGCGGAPKLSGFSPQQTPPNILHVFNGSKIGFYDKDGNFGFGSALKSIIDLGSSFGTSLQFVQDSSNGQFYLGQSCAGCNKITYFDGYTGAFFMSNLLSSQIALNNGGVASGVAVDDSTGKVYATDSANNMVTFLSGSTLGYAKSSLVLSTHTGPGSSVEYLSVDSSSHRVFITDPTDGSVVVLDGQTGSSVATQTTLLVQGGVCSSGQIGLLKTISNLNLLHVLCNTGSAAYDVMIKTYPGSPDYLSSTLAGSIFSLNPVTIANDLFYDETDMSLLVVGGSFIVAVNPSTGAITNSHDLSVNDCSVAGLSLSSVVYSSSLATIFVADKNNSRIYLLNPTTLAFKKNGSCAASNFATPDVLAPTKLTFF